jgi:hypothetical protein
MIQTWFPHEYLIKVVSQGNTRAARRLIQDYREDLRERAAELENLAKENNHPTTAKLFRDLHTRWEGILRMC